MMNSATAEARNVELHGPLTLVFNTWASTPQPEEANKYVAPAEGHREVLTHELSKIEQIIEYLKVLYR